MVFVVTAQHEHRSFARLDEITSHRKNEISAVHPLPKQRECGSIELGPRFEQRLAPAVEHLKKELAILRAETDRLLQHSPGDALGRSLDDRERVRTANASAHHV